MTAGVFCCLKICVLGPAWWLSRYRKVKTIENFGFSHCNATQLSLTLAFGKELGFIFVSRQNKRININ